MLLYQAVNTFILRSINFHEAAVYDESASGDIFKAGITLTTHEVVASHAYYGGADRLRGIVLLVDELDMASPMNNLSFRGSEHFMKASVFYGCSATNLSDDDKAAFDSHQFGTIFSSMTGPKKLVQTQDITII